MIQLFRVAGRSAPSGLVSPRLAALLRSPWLLVAFGVAIVACGAALALWLQPVPHSDWAYYWIAADTPSRYERGGVGLWLLGLLKVAGLSPITAALVLNATAVALLLWAMHRSDATVLRVPTLLLVAYLFLLAPFLGIVQLDMIAGAWMAMGFSLVLAPPARASRASNLARACVLFTLAVSTKQQYALIAWGMVGLFAVAWWWLRRRDTRVAATLMATLLVGSVAGFAIDLAARTVSTRMESMRTSSAVTLYGGMLVSSTGEGCGAWSVEAAAAAKDDLVKPLRVAVIDRLQGKRVQHWLAVMGCKAPHIVHPPAFAGYWLLEAPSVVEARNAHPDRARVERNVARARFIEDHLYSLLTWAILAFAIGVCAWCWRRGRPMAGVLPMLWVLAFWGVHLVFEIQGRYFLGMYLMMPLLGALALRNVARD